MTISLNKGENLSLTKKIPSLKHIQVGLGWDARATDGQPFDLDAILFMVKAEGKVPDDAHFIFYNQTKSPDGSVEHTGDNLTGAGDGDDESIKIDLNRIPQNVQRLVVCVTIHEADIRKQNFGMVSNAFVRIVNLDTNTEIIRYDLTEDASTNTAMIFGELYRDGSDWRFKAVGQGYAGGLRALAIQHGVNV